MPLTVLYMPMSLGGSIIAPNIRPDNGLGDEGERLHAWGVEVTEVTMRVLFNTR